MIIAATGHRPDKLGGYGFETRQRLQKIACEYLALAAVDSVISGMALGWDQAFAHAAYDLGIPYVAAVPFPGQEKRWPESSRAYYRKLLDRADDVVYVTPIINSASFTDVVKAMHRRNLWMVNNADLLCALWNGSDGGTANCVRHAESLGYPIDNVWNDFARCQ